VAKLEKRGDMHVSNLRRYIEALGGTLEITAHFDKTTVVISNIGETPQLPWAYQYQAQFSCPILILRPLMFRGTGFRIRIFDAPRNDVAAIDLDERGLEATRGELRELGRGHVVTRCDTSSIDSVAVASETIEKALGRHLF
jgi:hypothetical protein